jgi:hypothetical protein
VFDILVLLLNDLVTRQDNKVFFVNNIVEQQDQSSHVVQKGGVKLETLHLLDVE